MRCEQPLEKDKPNQSDRRKRSHMGGDPVPGNTCIHSPKGRYCKVGYSRQVHKVQYCLTSTPSLTIVMVPTGPKCKKED